MKKATFKILLISALIASLTFIGCNQTTESDKPNYADTEAVTAIGKALEARWHYTDNRSRDISQSEALSQATQIEIDALESYRSREYEDPKLQERVIAYINLLEQMAETAENIDFDSMQYGDQWENEQKDRSVMLKDFIENYGLTVADNYRDELNDMIKRGNLAAEENAQSKAIKDLVANMMFEKQNNGYSFFTYSCVAENTTDYDFGYVGLRLDLYDADGVKANETYASTNSWPRGERVRFETTSDVDASDIKVTISSFDVEKAG